MFEISEKIKSLDYDRLYSGLCDRGVLDLPANVKLVYDVMGLSYVFGKWLTCVYVQVINSLLVNSYTWLTPVLHGIIWN